MFNIVVSKISLRVVQSSPFVHFSELPSVICRPFVCPCELQNQLVMFSFSFKGFWDCDLHCLESAKPGVHQVKTVSTIILRLI